MKVIAGIVVMLTVLALNTNPNFSWYALKELPASEKVEIIVQGLRCYINLEQKNSFVSISRFSCLGKMPEQSEQGSYYTIASRYHGELYEALDVGEVWDEKSMTHHAQLRMKTVTGQTLRHNPTF